MTLDTEGIYRPISSEANLDQLDHMEVAKLPRRGSERADAEGRGHALLQVMRVQFDDALVTRCEELEGT